METIQTAFEKSLLKGKKGEDLIRGLLEKKGYVVYFPFTKGPHAFDFLAIKNKEKCIALDIKCKSHLTYENATGVNLEHFRLYEVFSRRHAMPFWLIFVDEHTQTIYGNEIKELEKPTFFEKKAYPRNMPCKTGATVRLWHLKSMKQIAKIKPEEAEHIKKLNQRNYNYP